MVGCMLVGVVCLIVGIITGELMVVAGILAMSSTGRFEEDDYFEDRKCGSDKKH